MFFKETENKTANKWHRQNCVPDKLKICLPVGKTYVPEINADETVIGIPVTGLRGLGGDQEVKTPRFLDTRHMKAIRSSTLRTGRLYPGTHFSEAESTWTCRVFRKQIPSDTTGDRSWDLPTSSAAPMLTKLRTLNSLHKI